MMETVYKCDTCGAFKTDANHWLIGSKIDGQSVYAQAWGYAIGNWNDVIEDACDHFCGWVCATKKLNAFLENKNGGAK